jgi:hypothetical protein
MSTIWPLLPSWTFTDAFAFVRIISLLKIFPPAMTGRVEPSTPIIFAEPVTD